MSDNEERDQAEIAQDVRASFEGGVRAMADWIPVLSQDPGKALAHLTWLGLSMAQHAQRMTWSVIEEEGTCPRFFSMDGALFSTEGRIVELDAEHFTIVDSS